MKKYYLFWFLYVLGVVFILAGAVNAGFSKYFMAIPFMILIVVISFRWLKNKKLVIFSVFLIILSIVINETQEYNPLLYPILAGGEVTVLENVSVSTYVQSGSSIISRKGDPTIKCTGCGEVVKTEIDEKETFDVLGVKRSHPSFGTVIYVVTKGGAFSEHYFAPRNGERKALLSVNKNIHAPWAENLSMLMNWPVAPLALISFLTH